jgi:hypothetical protein
MGTVGVEPTPFPGLSWIPLPVGIRPRKRRERDSGCRTLVSSRLPAFQAGAGTSSCRPSFTLHSRWEEGESNSRLRTFNPRLCHTELSSRKDRGGRIRTSGLCLPTAACCPPAPRPADVHARHRDGEGRTPSLLAPSQACSRSAPRPVTFTHDRDGETRTPGLLAPDQACFPGCTTSRFCSSILNRFVWRPRRAGRPCILAPLCFAARRRCGASGGPRKTENGFVSIVWLRRWEGESDPRARSQGIRFSKPLGKPTAIPTFTQMGERGFEPLVFSQWVTVLRTIAFAGLGHSPAVTKTYFSNENTKGAVGAAPTNSRSAGGRVPWFATRPVKEGGGVEPPRLLHLPFSGRVPSPRRLDPPQRHKKNRSPSCLDGRKGFGFKGFPETLEVHLRPVQTGAKARIGARARQSGP